MNENEMIDSGSPAARIDSVRVRSNYELEVTWAEGERAGNTDVVDLWPVIQSYKAYRPLRDDKRLFTTAHLLDDGYVVEWNGRDLEMSADLIEALAKQQPAARTERSGMRG
jgi:hypothetical protein